MIRNVYIFKSLYSTLGAYFLYMIDIAYSLEGLERIEMKDTRYPYRDITIPHQHRVTEISSLLADELNLSVEEKEILEFAARYHDIGKAIWPAYMAITKNRHMTPSQIKHKNQHPITSYEMIKDEISQFEGTWYNEHEDAILRIVRSHHENHNGKGYPDRLHGKRVNLSQKIIRLADAYDAMRSNRMIRSPENRKMSHERVENIINENIGIEFDPKVAKAFKKLNVSYLEEIYRTYGLVK